MRDWRSRRPMILSRRSILRLAALVPFGKLASVAYAQTGERQFRHALTLFEDIKYPADFRHFEYVNPQAPKGGRLRLGVVGSFDSLNPYSFKGESIGVAGNETLLTSSLDEPSTEYGLIAKEVWHPEDWAMVVY